MTCLMTSRRLLIGLAFPKPNENSSPASGAQYDSEVVYHNIEKELDKIGVIFVDTDTAVRDYPDLVKEYFGTVIPSADNQFAALNSAAWSGGSFIYVPPGCEG